MIVQKKVRLKNIVNGIIPLVIGYKYSYFIHPGTKLLCSLMMVGDIFGVWRPKETQCWGRDGTPCTTSSVGNAAQQHLDGSVASTSRRRTPRRSN